MNIELHKTLEKIILRDDVLEFAKMMSGMMNIKELEKESCNSFVEAMSGIELQMSRMKEQIQVSGVSSNFNEIYRRLLHVANYAMLAYNKVKTQ